MHLILVLLGAKLQITHFKVYSLIDIFLGHLVSSHSVTSNCMMPGLHQVIYTWVVAMHCLQREVIWTHSHYQLTPSELNYGSFDLKYRLMGRGRSLSPEQIAAVTSMCQAGHSNKEIHHLTGISLRSVQPWTRVFWQSPDGDIQTTW